jgi:hypothetical protein
VQPVLILGVSDLSIEVVEGHNSLGGKLPLSPIPQGNFSTKDVANASIRILVSITRVLVAFLFGLVLLIRSLIVPVVVLTAIFVTAVLPFSGV